jgi:multiple sugar transport system permease protein
MKRTGVLATGHRPPVARRYGPWLLLTPFLIGSLVLVGLPVALTFPLAFYEYDGLSPPIWRATQNFDLIFADPIFNAAIQNSVWFVALAVPLRMLGALALAFSFSTGGAGPGFIGRPCSSRPWCRISLTR